MTPLTIFHNPDLTSCYLTASVFFEASAFYKLKPYHLTAKNYLTSSEFIVECNIAGLSQIDGSFLWSILLQTIK